ncbi:MAG: ABC transporter permease [Flavobacterium sp.]
MITKLAWKNIWFKPLNTLLSLILLTASVAIISLLVLLQEQFEKQFSNNIDGIDMVIGAQGSPLQLILSAVYHIDAPTGNIDYAEAKNWMNHPFVEKAIPLAFGDNYRGFRIVGSETSYIEHYGASLQQGKLFEQSFEVVLGSEVAQKMQLSVGDTFVGTHGDAEEGHVHDEHPYVVVGILESTGKVIDNLIICSIESVWAVHDEHDHDHDHEAEDHVHEISPEITAVLIKFKSKMGLVTWPRLIPQNTKMQGALPAIEINRLFSLFGIGLQALEYLAYGIMLISGISIFIALYNRLRDRKYEFALMRVNGASRFQLLKLVLLESMFLCWVGFLLGIVISRIGLLLISSTTDDQFKMAFDPFVILWEKEGILFAVTIFVGLLAALIPAIKAYSLNISKTLAHA